MKFIRIFLLVLIIIGIVLLFTQKIWVPKVVDKILAREVASKFIPSNELEKADLIRLDTPKANQIIKSPLTITGAARGPWFFEASFPVVLVNWDGIILAQGVAHAKSNWMTPDFVPFEAKLTFIASKEMYSNKGTLILRKDNPSGLSKNNDTLEIPVIFDIN